MYFNIITSFIKRLIILLLIFLVISCYKGLDYKLKTDSGEFEYSISLQNAFKNMSKEDIDFFHFIINNIANIDSLETLDKKYHNQSPRYIIRQVINEKLDILERELNDLQIYKQRYDKILNDLLKIRKDRVYFNYINDILGVKPIISVTVTNLSSYDISSIYWIAKLYLNNDIEAITVSKFADIYNSLDNPYNAMFSNRTYNRKFELGVMRGYKNGKLISDEIKNAKSIKLVLDPILETAKDINGKYILPNNPYSRIDEIKGYLSRIEKNRSLY